MPPAVVKQQPKPRPPVAADDGDPWGSSSSVHMLLYGESGTGKTTFWASFPGPILALIRSGGKRSGELKSVDTPEFRRKITPKFINSSDDLRREVAKVGDEWGTVVLDHASGLADMILGEIIGRPVPEQKGWGLATQQQYGQMAMQAKEAFRSLLDLPCHVVIVAQQRTFGGRDDGLESDVIKPVVGAALTPSLTGWLNPACDFVVQTYKRPKMIQKEVVIGGKKQPVTERGKGVEYCLRTEPHETFMTKFRLPKGRALPECIVDPSFDKLQAVIDGEKVG